MACHGHKVDVDPTSLPINELVIPIELWRVILTYLTVNDLCRCCCVCREWNELVESLDRTYWKDMFLGNPAWRHPSWPRFLDDEPSSWKNTYKHHHVLSCSWLKTYFESMQSNCLGGIFKQKLERSVLHVGFDYEHKTLKSALTVADDFDTIMLHGPCVYDEQFEMTSRIPLEIVGCGELGSVVINLSMELNSPTTRLSNLVLKAPWFTGHVVKMKAGHLLVENCIFEEGQITLNSPATCHIRYSIFNNAFIATHNINVSLIENCEFTNLDGAAITVDAFPRSNMLWSHSALLQVVKKMKLNALDYSRTSTTVKATSEQTVTMADETRMQGPSFHSGSQAQLTSDSEENYLSEGSLDQDDYFEESSGASGEDLGLDNQIETTDTDSELSSVDSDNILEMSYHRHQLKQASMKLNTNTQNIECEWLKGRNLAFRKDKALAGLVEATLGLVISGCRIVECKGGLIVSNQAHCHMYNSELTHLQYGVRCILKAKVVLLRNSISNCKTSGVFMRYGASGLIADNDILSNGEAGIDVRKNANPVIQCNRIHHGKRSGIVVLGQGQGIIRGNDVCHNQEAGIYILYGGNPIIRENHVHQGQAAGIAVNEKGQGYIVDNLISHNRWGGIDVRHSGDPVIKKNIISNGLADGIVIGKDGSADVENNVITGNSGCGIWIMSGIKPFLHGNQISNNGDHGIAFVKYREAPHSMDADVADQSPDHQIYDDPSDMIGATNDKPTHHNKDAAVSYNQVSGNSGGGISIQGSEPIGVYDNTVHANHNTGITVNQSAPVSIDNNAITCNSGQGIHVEGFAKVEISQNGIYNNSCHGIVCKSHANIRENDVIGNGLSAIIAEGASKILVHNNRLSSYKDKVISIKGHTTAHIHYNSFRYKTSDVLEIDKSASRHNSIGDNTVILLPSKERLRQSFQSTYSDKPDWKLENPTPRPNIKESSKRQTLLNATTITHVRTGNCHGSQFCVIL